MLIPNYKNQIGFNYKERFQVSTVRRKLLSFEKIKILFLFLLASVHLWRNQ